MEIDTGTWGRIWEKDFEIPLMVMERIRENHGKVYYINDEMTTAKETDGVDYVFDKRKIYNLATWYDYEGPAKGRIFSLGFLVPREMGIPYFSFDKKKVFNIPRDCKALTPEQLKIVLIPLSFWIVNFCLPSDFSEECLRVLRDEERIFDRENPYWAAFFSDRKKKN